LGLTPNAQKPETPHAVPLKDEPHYRLIFENTYVRVFGANLLGHTTTVTHRHDLPYVYITVGPADFIDAVTDKTGVHMVMTDGQVGYSQGGFAHVIRTEAGSPLDLVIIELLKPRNEVTVEVGTVRHFSNLLRHTRSLNCNGRDCLRYHFGAKLWRIALPVALLTFLLAYYTMVS